MSGPQPSPHLDLDRLADLLAGEGTDDDVAHVGQCSGCAGRLDELSVAEVEVAAALAALPAPPLPAGLADRLTAALAAEPPLDPSAAAPDRLPTAEATDRPAASRTVTPFPTAARRRRWQPLAAAAGLLVVAGGLGGALLLGGTSSQDDDVAASGAESGDTAAGPAFDLPTSSTGQDYASPGTLAAALPGLLTGGARAASPSALTTGLTSGGTAEGSPAPAAAPDTAATRDAGDPLARLREPAELASCLAALLPEGDDAVLALDYAAYGGQPALTVVLPASGAPDKVDVFVVGAGCRLGDDRTLFFTRLDRP